jgi:quercetin 2,3-dioxygenase
MNIVVHKANERGTSSNDWLESKHSFSFNNYYDPKKMGFGLLRVLNDDIIGPSKGFDMHPHANMEIVSIVLQGALEHKDSMGNAGTIHAKEIQRMSAGTGIMHSEWNPSKTEKGRFLQIWLKPKKMNIKPSYEQASYDGAFEKKGWTMLIHPEKKKGALAIQQDAYFSIGNFEKNKKVNYALNNKNNGAYLFVLEGAIEIEKNALAKRDAIGITKTEVIHLKTVEPSKLLLLEVPMI